MWVKKGAGSLPQHSRCPVLNMPSRLWLNMLTTDERTTLATHAVILDATDKQARTLPKHDSMDGYTHSRAVTAYRWHYTGTQLLQESSGTGTGHSARRYGTDV